MKKYKVIVFDHDGNEQPLPETRESGAILEMIFHSEKSRIYYYENMKVKYPGCSIKMMMCV